MHLYVHPCLACMPPRQQPHNSCEDSGFEGRLYAVHEPMQDGTARLSAHALMQQQKYQYYTALRAVWRNLAYVDPPDIKHTCHRPGVVGNTVRCLTLDGMALRCVNNCHHVPPFWSLVPLKLSMVLALWVTKTVPRLYPERGTMTVTITLTERQRWCCWVMGTLA